jgi:hypothetical protein
LNPAGTDDWYFIHLEFGRASTDRQTFAQKMEFNEDGTIKPIKLTNQGVGALRQLPPRRPNLALTGAATASSVQPDRKIKSDPSLDRTETFAPAFATDDSNGSRWLAATGDATPWWQIDLGAPCDIVGTEVCFVKPAAGHAYKLEASLDGQTWTPYGGHTDVVLRSPHVDQKPARVRYLRLTILAGEPGLWEFRVLSSLTGSP